jgi:hypothetical protein
MLGHPSMIAWLIARVDRAAREWERLNVPRGGAVRDADCGAARGRPRPR